jgi:hypothetical protein
MYSAERSSAASISSRAGSPAPGGPALDDWAERLVDLVQRSLQPS